MSIIASAEVIAVAEALTEAGGMDVTRMRDEGDGILDSMEEAVRKMTGLTAQVFGLRDRGVICPGAKANLVLFDLAVVIDAASFEDPMKPSPGIEQVWVNGESVYRWGEGVTGARPGVLIENPRASA
jgi:N-acyl-D-amino-acid deacylase